MKKTLILSASLLVATPSLAQEPISAQPAQSVAVQATKAPETGVVLPANTEVLLKTTQEVTTKGKTWSEGDTFNMSVVHDVMLGDYVVIPAGTRGVGRITWLTNKGAFGKSGKMDVELEYLELNGRRINIDGTYRQEGEGNTMATVGGVILAGVFAGFITGKSGRIPQGRELMATLETNLPVSLPEGASIPQAGAPIQAQAMQPVQAAATQQQQQPRQSQGFQRVQSADQCPDGTTARAIGGQNQSAMQGDPMRPAFYCEPTESVTDSEQEAE